MWYRCRPPLVSFGARHVVYAENPTSNEKEGNNMPTKRKNTTLQRCFRSPKPKPLSFLHSQEGPVHAACVSRAAVGRRVHLCERQVHGWKPHKKKRQPQNSHVQKVRTIMPSTVFVFTFLCDDFMYSYLVLMVRKKWGFLPSIPRVPFPLACPV